MHPGNSGKPSLVTTGYEQVCPDHSALKQALSLFDEFPYDRVPLESALNDDGSRVYVGKDKPRIALLSSKIGICFIAGQFDPGEINVCLDYPLRQVDAGQIKIDFISLPSEESGRALQQLYGHRFYVAERISLILDSQQDLTNNVTSADIPKAFTISRIDEVLAARVASEVDASFAIYWPDPTEFVSSSIGYCVLQDNRIVSVAWSVSRVPSEVEIAVATVPDYRGQGLCEFASKPLIEYCKENHIRLHWSTWIHNHPSLRAARKLGFTDEVIHYWAQYTPWNADRYSVEIPMAVLNSYCGVYRLDTGKCLYISTDDRKLFVQFWDAKRPRYEVIAESSDRFFLAEDDIQFVFTSEPGGLIYTNAGSEKLAKCIT